MICINQQMATRSKEPFSTLSLIRRQQNKSVTFGQHLKYIPQNSSNPQYLRRGVTVTILNCTR